MSNSFWEDVKHTVTSGFNVAAEKTKEYTKIGKLEIDILNLKRAVDKSTSVLGKKTYQIYKSGKQADISQDNEVKDIIKKIDGLYDEINANEKEIKKIKKEESKKKPEQDKSKRDKTASAKPEAKESPKKSAKSASPKTGKGPKSAAATKKPGSKN